jgi:hypothetical protein
MNRGGRRSARQQSKLGDFGFAGIEVKRDKFPLQAACPSCGRTRWLTWVVGGSRVCDECKAFMVEKKNE